MDISIKFPPKPRTIAETGLSISFLTDLALKTIYVHGMTLGSELVEAIKLPFVNVVEPLLTTLESDKLVQVIGSEGDSPSAYKYVITREGRLRARELMDQCQYTGPAPVTLAVYSKMVTDQSLAGQGVAHEDFTRALEHLVLPDDFLSQLGPAINSGKPIFLYGHTGNGKTSIGLAIGAMLTSPIWMPYAIVVEGQIIKVYDALVHHKIQEDTESRDASPRKGLLSRLVVEKTEDVWTYNSDMIDRRWALIHRPVVVGGGELTLKDLDLVFDPVSKYYEAPHQIKASGGVFLVDDLGRQKTKAQAILNRWIMPMEKRTDFLTPQMGNRIEVPFDAFLVFATNLDPSDVADEVFLRRLRHKIQCANPTWEAYAEIFRREAAKHHLAFSEDALRHIVREYYVKPKREPRGVHPRDILDELIDIARYRGVRLELTHDLLDLACQAYFLKGESQDGVN